MTRTRLYSRQHDVCLDVEPGSGRTLIVEIRVDEVVGRIILSRRDLKGLLRFSTWLYAHDNVLHAMLARHLRPGRGRR